MVNREAPARFSCTHPQRGPAHNHHFTAIAKAFPFGVRRAGVTDDGQPDKFLPDQTGWFRWHLWRKSPRRYDAGGYTRMSMHIRLFMEPREERGLEDRYVSLPVSSVADLTIGFSSSGFGGGNSFDTCKNSGW